MTQKLNITSRILIAVGSLGLTATYFYPVWFIFLIAPQYPEGLTMNIWLDRLSGQVDIINGLNHYIGMKHIEASMFPEFSYLKYVVAFFILFGLVVAIVGKRKLLGIYLVLSIIGGIAAMVDFYQWGYNYGHHLDPKAAIQVPGLVYQPPLFGHKTILNFDAYSYPDIGGWIVVAISTMFAFVWFVDWYKKRRVRNVQRHLAKKAIPVAASTMFLFMSCNSGPETIAYGKDMCDDCRMAIIEPQFAGEIVSKKGKVYKFDDAHCLVNFLDKGRIKEETVANIYFIDFDNQKEFVDASIAYGVTAPALKSPMGGNTAFFASKEKANSKASETGRTAKPWNEIRKNLLTKSSN